MKFGAIEAAIGGCKKHLDATRARGTQIESFMAGYLLVLISAHFEVRVRGLIEARAARAPDKQIRSFVTSAAAKIIRGPKIDQITGMLNSFDPSCGELFHKTAGDQAKSAYDSIIANRHTFVHDGICNVTLGDVERFFGDSAGVFSAIIAGLGLKAKEVAHLF